jgi:selenide,water dikinase
MPGPSRPRKELVLVGGGHAHVQVLRRLAMAPPSATRVTVVVDTPVAVYSGMVPGFVAGQYRAEELEIDVLPLARRAGARVVMSPMTGLDPRLRLVLLEGRPPIPFDVASLDVGSTVAGLDTPGVREHALPTRPIGVFVRRVEETLARSAEAPAASRSPSPSSSG